MSLIWNGGVVQDSAYNWPYRYVWFRICNCGGQFMSFTGYALIYQVGLTVEHVMYWNDLKSQNFKCGHFHCLSAVASSVSPRHWLLTLGWSSPRMRPPNIKPRRHVPFFFIPFSSFSLVPTGSSSGGPPRQAHALSPASTPQYHGEEDQAFRYDLCTLFISLTRLNRSFSSHPGHR